ncbi:MAG: hypothetical protein V3S01_09300 [Dehalococcoidia bacterium]
MRYAFCLALGWHVAVLLCGHQDDQLQDCLNAGIPGAFAGGVRYADLVQDRPGPNRRAGEHLLRACRVQVGLAPLENR